MELHTKSDFTALARKILNPLLPLYSAGGARLHLGDTGVTYPARTIEMEAFSRPLWALGPCGQAAAGPMTFWPSTKRVLPTAPTRKAPEYWGAPNDYDQLFVEMAALACAILETPENVWASL